MERKLRLLRQVVKFYSVHHVSENKHKQELLDFIDDIEKQLTLTSVVKPFYCANKQEDFLEDCKSQCEECRLEVCEIKQ
jgi:ferritin